MTMHAIQTMTRMMMRSYERRLTKLIYSPRVTLPKARPAREEFPDIGARTRTRLNSQ